MADMSHSEAEELVRQHGQDQLRHLEADELPAPLRLSNRLSSLVDAVGRFGSWFMLPLVLITVFDLGLRKTGEVQLWLIENVSSIFGSTLLQELEWHSHTVLFTLVLAYGYIWNTHVRVDLLRENLAFKKKAWIEFIGLTFFFIPYCCVLAYFAFIYAYDAYQIGEISASLVGLSHRWIIKSFLFAGHCCCYHCGSVRLAAAGYGAVWTAKYPLPADGPLNGRKKKVAKSRAKSAWI